MELIIEFAESLYVNSILQIYFWLPFDGIGK